NRRALGHVAVVRCISSSVIDNCLINTTDSGMPAPGSALEQAVLALAEQRPLLRARDLAALGLPTMALSRLVAAGRLERV
ncbi:type IV toxin-antitoxin system AbiEi family antitoxin domain-containing protein, partial [Klebsiella quasipneumoniae]|uniref:type IV toxin-antitoxin system AbiEi family antitoxin domain-containing protein n=1 Tax=Klebsiella quasipneumoniae TaxID=1463165 RepID=UPI002731D3FA